VAGAASIDLHNGNIEFGDTVGVIRILNVTFDYADLYLFLRAIMVRSTRDVFPRRVSSSD